MKDEIKEILDDLGNKDSYINDETILTFDEAKDILDYITNLQEENEILKQEQIGKYQTLKELQQENERLKKELNALRISEEEWLNETLGGDE